MLWAGSDNALWAVIAAVVAEICAFAPTYRKSFSKPHEETVSSYAGAAVAVALSLFALESHSLTSWLYPVSVLVTNALFVAYVIVRRKQLRK